MYNSDNYLSLLQFEPVKSLDRVNSREDKPPNLAVTVTEVTWTGEKDEGVVSPKGSSLDGDRGNIALLLFLYTLQGIPLGLISAVPMILQSKGVLYKDQAMFSLSHWPFSIKLLWAPIVDSVFSKKFGRRKTWLIPTQYLIGVFMLILSYRVNFWVTDPAGPHMVLLTSLFLVLNFLAATQDIAVDGWALTMLKRTNVGYASACNSIGQTAGSFIGYVVFTTLESADFCNSYLRSSPQPEGILPLDSFLFQSGLVFLVTTTLVGLLKREAEARPEEESNLDIISTYRQLLRIVRLPTVRTFALVLLTCKISFCACDAITKLKLIDLGVPREQFAMVYVFLVPLQIALPIILSKYLVGQAPMDVYVKAYPFRLGFNFVAAGFVFLTPHLIEKHNIPMSYHVLLVIYYSLYQVTMYSMFVTQMAFFARISDPAMGGTYMTLLNTVANLGGSWPNTLILLFVDVLTFKNCSSDGSNNCASPLLVQQCTKGEGECSTWLDGYYILICLTTVYGLLWSGWGRRTIRALQRKSEQEWKVTSHHQR